MGVLLVYIHKHTCAQENFQEHPSCSRANNGQAYGAHLGTPMNHSVPTHAHIKKIHTQSVNLTARN